MSNHRKNERKREVAKIREIARANHAAGKRRNDHPYRYADKSQYENEWDSAEWEAERAAEDAARREKASQFDEIRSDIANGLHGKALSALVDIIEGMQEIAV
jgi:hypothetical protein